VVQDRLKALHGDLESGVRTRPNYTVGRAAEDWLNEGLVGRSAKTIEKNEHVLAPILATIGARKATRAVGRGRAPGTDGDGPAPPWRWDTTR
jgi:hypothetical protein